MLLKGEVLPICTKSRMEGVRSNLAQLKAEEAEPRLLKLWVGVAESRDKWSAAGVAKPERAKLRSKGDGPKIAESMTGRLNIGPKRATPKSNMHGPMRARFRIGKALPGCKESGAKAADSKRLKLRVNSGEPKCKRSITSSSGPVWEQEHTGKAGLRRVEHRVGMESPGRKWSEINAAGPARARCCAKSNDPGCTRSVASSGTPNRAFAKRLKGGPGAAGALAGRMGPKRALPKTEKPEPIWPIDRKGEGGPKCRESGTKGAKPTRAALRMEKVGPGCKRSETDEAAPRRE